MSIRRATATSRTPMLLRRTTPKAAALPKTTCWVLITTSVDDT
ncbi:MULTISPECIES: hypothetical protein [unclassified Mycobacterium]|nr:MULTISPECIES: hypothetical protein [unclassified Mycobacterium]